MSREPQSADPGAFATTGVDALGAAAALAEADGTAPLSNGSTAAEGASFSPLSYGDSVSDFEQAKIDDERRSGSARSAAVDRILAEA